MLLCERIIFMKNARIGFQKNLLIISEYDECDEIVQDLYSFVVIKFYNNNRINLLANHVPSYNVNPIFDDYININNLDDVNINDLVIYDDDIIKSRDLFSFWRKTIYIKPRLYEFNDSYKNKYDKKINMEYHSSNVLINYL